MSAFSISNDIFVYLVYIMSNLHAKIASFVSVWIVDTLGIHLLPLVVQSDSFNFYKHLIANIRLRRPFVNHSSPMNKHCYWSYSNSSVLNCSSASTFNLSSFTVFLSVKISAACPFTVPISACTFSMSFCVVTGSTPTATTFW